MTPVGISKAKNRLCELVDRASRGEEIVITRHGEQVARLMPLPAPAPKGQGQARALAERIRRSRSGQALGEGVSMRQLVEGGRR